MVLIVRGTDNFLPAPEGLHAGVCVDVIDEGLQQTPWGEKPKVTIIWEIDALDSAHGRRFTVRKRYTASLHEKSNLNKDLKAWRGKAFTAEELGGFDIEKVLGAPCQLLVQHHERDGAVYANVTAIMRADPKLVLKPSGAYVRAKDRPANANEQAQQPVAETYPDIPF